MLKRFASYLPQPWQQGLKKVRFRRQIRLGLFEPGEPEYQILDSLVTSGDWALDVGANVGHYTARLSSLVGPAGRVFAFEPIPETFEVLAANALHFPFRNVSLINAAASDHAGLVSMDVPFWNNGLKNYYEAHISQGGGGLQVYCCPLDSFLFEKRVSLVKIDAEGHEMPVLSGIRGLLERDRPALIVETGSAEAADFLTPFGYEGRRMPGSPNILFQFKGPTVV